MLSVCFSLRISSSRESKGLGGVDELELDSIVRAMDKDQGGRPGRGKWVETNQGKDWELKPGEKPDRIGKAR